jgi:putative transposase
VEKHRHLRRLAQLWAERPIFFITACTARRQPILNTPASASVLESAFHDCTPLHGWSIGRYVIMPDHLHFFAVPTKNEAKSLSDFMKDFKRWTARQISSNGQPPPIWQKSFFDHVLRSSESYAQKWDYVRLNPVWASLVATPEAWPYQGEITLLDPL